MYEKLSKNALKCMYIATGVGTLFIYIVAAILEIALFYPKNWIIAHIIVAIVGILLLLNAIISPWFRYNRYRYKIDDECIDIEEGYIFVTRDIVPIERLHKLQIERGPIDKLCGVAKIMVTTAGGDVTIRFLEEERANIITEGLKKRINEIAVIQKEQQKEQEQITENKLVEEQLTEDNLTKEHTENDNNTEKTDEHAIIEEHTTE